MDEAAFELALCTRLERDREAVVARQLGAGVARPGNRVADVVLVEPGPAFVDRARLTDRTIPPAAIESDVGPGRARRWRAAFDCHPERARRAVDRAVEVGFFERERDGGRDLVRQVARYPDWIGGLVGVENKPDLGMPGALQRQLRTDVSLGLFDRVVLATASHVTGAHRNRIPDAVGIWRVHGHDDLDDPTRIEVLREPEPLGDGPGVELLERQPGRADIAVVGAAEKDRARRRVAERAYGKGWRPASLPGCAEVSHDDGLPCCAWKAQPVDPADCGPACPGFDSAEPPSVDADAARERHTPWVSDPAGEARRQAGLDRFG